MVVLATTLVSACTTDTPPTRPPPPFGEQGPPSPPVPSACTGSQATTLAVDLASALRRAPKDATVFDIAPSEVLAGDPAAIRSGGRGARTGGGVPRRFVSVTVAGSWHPSEGCIRVLDARGREPTRSGVGTGYSKYAAGVVGPGVTQISVFVDDATDLSRLTFILRSE